MPIPIHLEKIEAWDEDREEFVTFGPSFPIDILMEHSLVSIYKWESKYHKSYINTEDKTLDESLDYYQMMVIGAYENKLDKDIFKALTKDQIIAIGKYINDPQTATTFSGDKEDKKDNTKKKSKKLNGDIITAEIIYYWMTALNIPFECQFWHVNKLITLVRVCSIKNEQASSSGKKKKMTSTDMMARRARMQAARAKYKH